MELSPQLPPGGSDLIKDIKDTGYCIGARGKALLRLDTDRHFITMASTGSGKGRSVVIPNLLLHPGSVFTTEIGGANVKATIKYRRDILCQSIYVIDPLEATDEPKACLNLLDTLDSENTTFTSDVELMAQSILQDNQGKSSEDPYWVNAPKELLKALIFHVKTAPSYEIDDQDRHFPYITELLAKFETEEWDELMQRWAVNQGPYKAIFNDVGNAFFQVYNDNTRSVLSVLKSYLGFARNPQFIKYLKSSSFDLKDLRNKKITVYLVMPLIEYYKANSTWLRLVVERALNACPDLKDRKTHLPYHERILFMLDEFTQLGKLDAIDTGMQTARHKGITLWCVFQDFNRLKEVYKENIAHSFLGSAACIQTFGINDLPTAEFISKRAGKRVAYIPSVTEGINWSDGITENWNETTTTGINFNQTQGISKGQNETWSQGFTAGSTYGTTSSNTTSRSSSSNWGGTYSSTSGRSSSKTTGDNKSWQNSQTNQYGGGSSQTINESYSKGTSQQESVQEGKAINKNQGGQYSVSYTPQILPALEPDQVIEAVSDTKNGQILILKERVILDGRANFDQIEILKQRVDGPSYFLNPPRPTGLLDKPNALSFWTPVLPHIETELNVIYQPLECYQIPIFGEIVASKTLKIKISPDVKTDIIAQNLFQIDDLRQQAQNTLANIVTQHSNINLERIQKFNQYRKYFDYDRYLENCELSLVKLIHEDLLLRINSWQKYVEKIRSYNLFIKSIQSKIEVLYETILVKFKELEDYNNYLNNYSEQMNSQIHNLENYKQDLKFYHEYLEDYYRYREVWTQIEQPKAPEIENQNFGKDHFSLKSEIFALEQSTIVQIVLPKLEEIIAEPSIFPQVDDLVDIIQVLEVFQDFDNVKTDITNLEQDLQSEKRDLQWKLWKQRDKKDNLICLSNLNISLNTYSLSHRELIKKIHEFTLELYEQSYRWNNHYVLWQNYSEYLTEHYHYLLKYFEDLSKCINMLNQETSRLSIKHEALLKINSYCQSFQQQLFSTVPTWKIWQDFEQQTKKQLTQNSAY